MFFAAQIELKLKLSIGYLIIFIGNTSRKDLKAQKEIQEQLISLPKSPGVYQYFDKDGKILYVGKAKNLRNRVRSYFTGQQLGKTRLLVKRIVDIQFIIVDSEQEALLLENSLIKKYQPPYNIQLKDDKTFPWIVVKKERFPRVMKVRNPIKDGSKYYGPYSNVRMADTLMDLIHKLYPLRNCNYDLSIDNIKHKKFKRCLEFHIGNCKGACEALELEKEYEAKIQEIHHILKGNVFGIKKSIKEKMLGFSANMEFEKAQVLKEKLEQLEKYQAKYTVVSPRIANVDVFTIVNSDKKAYVNFLRVINGAIVQGHTVEVKTRLEERKEEMLERVITDFNIRFEGLAKEIIVPFAVEVPLAIKFTIPQRGDKLKLLQMSEKNAVYFSKEKMVAAVPPETQVLEGLKKQLRLKDLPVHIECFDNSNIQGTSPMSACVVFKQGKPAKKDYRLFKIRTVEGPNDFASMEEVVFRRYSRLISEQLPLPQLLIIDGGKGQLSAAMKSIDKLGLRGKITVIGIAKRLEELFFPGDSLPLYLDKKSSGLKLIQQLRNEAHRFSLKGHRNRRSKNMLKSELDDIAGIGKQTKEQLLRSYGSVREIEKQSLAELTNLIGKAKANIIHQYFVHLKAEASNQ